MLLLFSFTVFRSNGQCSSTGAQNGSNFSDDNSTGNLTFSSTGNASTSDNNHASASALLTLLTGNTHYLRATGFNFAIPSTAVICGIVAEVEKSASNISLLATVTDNSVRLVKGGTITGNNYAKATEWPTTENYYTYGSINDLWGTTWTPAEINASNFGIVFSSHISGLITLLPSARIDHIRMTVYYNLVLPISIATFRALSTAGNMTMLQWVTQNNDEEVAFTIQRSNDEKNWENIATIAGKTASTDKTYQYTDADNKYSLTFYRLKIKHQNQNISFSGIVTTKQAVNKQFSLFPNPVSDYMIIETDQPTDNVRCINMFGQTFSIKLEKTGNNQFRANVKELPSGMYIIKVNDKTVRLIKK